MPMQSVPKVYVRAQIILCVICMVLADPGGGGGGQVVRPEAPGASQVAICFHRNTGTDTSRGGSYGPL